MAFDEITPEEAEKRRGEFRAIDVRADYEYRGPLGHVRDAMLVPLPELEARSKELPRDRPLLLICRSGVRSGKACEQLAALGIGPVVNLRGGMIAWNRASQPVECVQPASLAEFLDQVVRWVAQVSAQTPDAVRKTLGSQLESLGASANAPTRAALACVVDSVGSSLTDKGAPPDLDLSVATFRRWLGVL